MRRASIAPFRRRIRSYLVGMIALLVCVVPSGLSARAAQDMAPQAVLTISPSHGGCGVPVDFEGSEFFPNSTVVLQPLWSASARPYVGAATYEVTTDGDGRFSAQIDPCPEGMIGGVTWSAEPPGRPYFEDGAFAIATYTLFDINSSQFFPETGYTVSGEFLFTWQQAGGLSVFGYPLTDAHMEQNPDTGEDVLVQYFERQRFELHPEFAGTPYLVLLGRLGDELLQAQGRDWQSEPGADPGDPHYFPETGHAIAPEFWQYWSQYGLDFGDQPAYSIYSFRESLALFGYPLTEPAVETNADGDTVLTQYFERAVFEFHPENPQQWQVLLRRTGAEVLAAQ
ncbi:MAG: hypothetical protein M9890_15235 [Thermomicrobiales bacterium]|nr:hypothetical protein [Thermomicrobiales bacterium]